MRQYESLLIIPKVNSVQNIFAPAKNKLGSHIQRDVSQRPYTSGTEKKIQVKMKYFQIKQPGVVCDKRGFFFIDKICAKASPQVIREQGGCHGADLEVNKI